MNRVEHLLTILGEECAEVAQRASKASRFGLLEVQQGGENITLLNNAQRIVVEYADILAVVRMLEEEGHLKIDIGEVAQMIQKKREKVEKYLLYAAEVGTLTKTPLDERCCLCHTAKPMANAKVCFGCLA